MSRTIGEPRRRGWVQAALVAALLPGLASAADPAPPQVHAIVGARVVVGPGRVFPEATVVLRDGIIEACGPRVKPPPDARIWPGAGRTVFAGLIEPYAVVSAGASAAPAPATAPPEIDPPGEHPLILAARGCDTAPPAAAQIQSLRSAGFATAVFAPADGLFRGSSCVANLGAGSFGANLLRPSFAQHVRLEPFSTGGRYPASLMGAVALFRQTVLDSLWQRQAHEAYRRNPAQARPLWNANLAALEAVARAEAPVVFEAKDVLDTLRALALTKELRLRALIVGSGEEYKRLAEIGRRPVPFILPLAFPPRPTVPAVDDLTLGLDELREWREAPENPRRVIEAGLTVAFTTARGREPVAIFGALEKAIARGLPADQALAGLTTVPAELLGLSGRCGTVEAGKMANLLVVEGELFVEKPKLQVVWIDGRPYELEAAKKPAATPAPVPSANATPSP